MIPYHGLLQAVILLCLLSPVEGAGQSTPFITAYFDVGNYCRRTQGNLQSINKYHTTTKNLLKMVMDRTTSLKRTDTFVRSGTMQNAHLVFGLSNPTSYHYPRHDGLRQVDAAKIDHLQGMLWRHFLVSVSPDASSQSITNRSLTLPRARKGRSEY